VKTILILDTETSSLDPKTGHLLEVATALWSVEHRSLIKARSWILRAESNEAESVNGIPTALLMEQPLATTMKITELWVLAWAGEADAIVAHGDFDRKWFGNEIQSRTWIDSCDDIEWPRASTSRSLVALALAHGVGVSHAHRALSDVMTLVQLFERAAEMTDVSAMLTKAARTKRSYRAVVNYDTNALAKERGFRWDPERKIWHRRIAIEDATTKEWPFKLEEVGA
jgi:DNA polymerase-3 subunit epsilon